ncbi:MAG: type II secretion system F family protein [Fusobacteriota bacterium]
MAIYKYKARDREGLAITGELEVDNEKILSDELRSMGYVLVSYEKQDNPLKKDIFEKYKKVKRQQLVEFSIETATLLEAGVPLLGALEVMEEQSKGTIFYKVLRKVRTDIEGGMSFSQALDEHPNTFSKLYVNMIRAGEATGNLDKILKNLGEYLENIEANHSKIKSAMMYPLGMLLVSVVVVIFLLTKVLPRFANIFKSSGISLPIPTKIMLGTSNILTGYWFYIILFIGMGIYGIKRYINTEKGRYYFDLFKFKIPIFGDIIKKGAITKFTRTFGTLLESSVPILEALDIVQNTVGNEVISKIIKNIKDSVTQGESISQQIEYSGIFPKIVGKMISVGEKTGTMDKMLFKISDFYDSEIENKIKGLTSILEPIMIVGMGLVIGVIVMSVMLPMFDMMQLAK